MMDLYDGFICYRLCHHCMTVLQNPNNDLDEWTFGSLRYYRIYRITTYLWYRARKYYGDGDYYEQWDTLIDYLHREAIINELDKK